MDSSIIVIDSDEEESQDQKIRGTLQIQTTEPNPLKRQSVEHNGNSVNDAVPPKKIRRIQPQKIGEVSTSRRKNSDDENDNKNEVIEVPSKDSLDSSQDDKMNTTSQAEEDGQQQNDDAAGPSSTKQNDEKQAKSENETEELKIFIRACRRAENNEDMEKIIKKKLRKNYHLVSPSYVLSKNFRKLLKDTATDIIRDPKRVYSKIQDVVNELEARKNTKIEVVVEVPVEPTTSQVTSEEPSEENGIPSSPRDKKKDEHLKKLNKALGQLKKKIDDLEEAEVNLEDDDDSAYMQKVRYEKRAIEIYNKICVLTDESSHAHRIVKKPIKFKDMKFKEFSKMLTKKVNRENGFPSYFDVYRLLDYCNKEHKYCMSNREIKDVAERSFQKVGELLKERRRNDLWESACHYLGENKDPAKDDQELKTKLEVNKEVYRKKTEELLEFYTKKQYEECSKNEQPCTSAIKEEEYENEDIIIKQSYEPSTSPPLQGEMLIDVKAEEVIECDKDSSASVVNLSILS